MITCGDVPRIKVLVTPLCRGLGARFILAKVGLTEVAAQTQKPGEDIKFCDECGRYYNPKSEHECISKRIKDNQRTLERWLGRYTKREE